MPTSRGAAAGLAVLLLAGCGGAPEKGGGAPAAEDDGRIACATGGLTEFARTCEVERVAGPEGLALIVRHPDGGFRRFLVRRDGRGLEPADGAQPARLAVIGEGLVEVEVAGDRYRFPATLKGAAKGAGGG